MRAVKYQSDAPLTKPDEVAALIRNQITLGALGPGVLLTQDQLSGRFGAGRPALREALSQLANEGIVTHHPNRGFFVSDISTGEARQLFRLMDVADLELLPSVQWPDWPRLERLAACAQSLRQAAEGAPLIQLFQIERDFESRLAELSEQDVIVREAERWRNLAERYLSLIATRALANALALAKSETVAALRMRNREALIDSRSNRRRELSAMVLDALRDRGW
jgi:DNA-binding GntR family transcriptional regulator